MTIYTLVYHYSYAEVEHKLQQNGSKIADHLRLYSYPSLFGKKIEVMLEGYSKTRLKDQKIYVQIDLFDPKSVYFSSNMIQENIRFTVGERNHACFTKTDVDGIPFVIYQVPIVKSGSSSFEPISERIGCVQVGTTVIFQVGLLQKLWKMLVINFFIALVVAVSSGLLLARKLMEPLIRVIHAANQIQSGDDLRTRIQYHGPADEMGQLIQTVNNMLKRTEVSYRQLENAYAVQHRFVSDASHELRTPLTTIRGNIDFLQKLWDETADDRSHLTEQNKKQMALEAIHDIAEESKRMSRLINDMLCLARADASYPMEMKPVAMEPLVNDVLRRTHHLHRTCQFYVDGCSALDGVYVNGNADRLQQMLFIFMDNAFKYTPKGAVHFSTMLYKGQIGLQIKDTGMGMDKNEVPFIFDRFYRADESRGLTSGIGLGLSIAKQIIDDHQGSVEVVTKRAEGTTFMIWLPMIVDLSIE